MSGDAPDREEPLDTPLDRDALAAEYVLGLLGAEERRVVTLAMDRDPAMARAVDGWIARLEPLASLAEPVPPSDVLWRRIARDLPGGGGESAPIARSGMGRVVWRVVALGGYGLAAGLAIALLLSRHRVDIHVAWDAPPAPAAATPPPVPRPEPSQAALPAPLHTAPASPQAPAPPVRPARVAPGGLGDTAVALLSAAGADQPAMKAFFTQGGNVRLVPVQPVHVPPDKQLGFWVWPRGTALPIPLGRVDPGGGTLRFPYREADGTPVMVTLEPRHLPLSDAQGPTLFTGRLVAVD